MKTSAIIGVILIAAGVLALVYGQFSYTTERGAAQLGPIEFTVEERETVNIPTWLGAGSIVAGTALLVIPLLRK